jgi:hypothetical protein
MHRRAGREGTLPARCASVPLLANLPMGVTRIVGRLASGGAVANGVWATAGSCSRNSFRNAAAGWRVLAARDGGSVGGWVGAA